jgi:hypothetical protein
VPASTTAPASTATLRECGSRHQAANKQYSKSPHISASSWSLPLKQARSKRALGYDRTCPTVSSL